MQRGMKRRSSASKPSFSLAVEIWKELLVCTPRQSTRVTFTNRPGSTSDSSINDAVSGKSALGASVVPSKSKDRLVTLPGGTLASQQLR